MIQLFIVSYSSSFQIGSIEWLIKKNKKSFTDRPWTKKIQEQTELKKLRIQKDFNIWTEDELDAIAYFEGTGFYQKYQDPKLKPNPNIFETRQTYLLKMHDPIVRRNFLNSLKK